MFKSGIVSIVGSPNAGKSSLLNKLFQRKLAIVSNKVQTTRNLIRGIYNDEDSQIVFVDTPGFHKPRNKLQGIMNHQIDEALSQTDLLIYMLDARYGFGKKEQQNLLHIQSISTKKKICLINKVDLITHQQVIALVNQAQEFNLFDDVYAISIKNGFDEANLIQTIKHYLPEGLPFFEENQLTDYTNEFYISEIIREKINLLTKDELPHSAAVKILEIENKPKKLIIVADIYVQRNSQKAIIIGKHAEIIKKIGKLSRIELEKFFQKHIYLDLQVKVRKNWDNNLDILNDFGFSE